MSVQLFESEILNVSIASVVCKNGEVHFKTRDVAEPLGYVNTKGAVDRHVWNENKFEWCNVNKWASDSSPLSNVGGIHARTLFLTEPGVYQLIFRSELPTARSCYGENQRREYKTVLKTHANMLKGPVNEQRGRRGGLRALENRRKLVEFKNMFIELYETLFGSE